MIIVCAWCKKELGEKEPIEDKSITHTICSDCEKKMFNEGDQDKTKTHQEDYKKGSGFKKEVMSSTSRLCPK